LALTDVDADASPGNCNFVSW